ncbi:protein FATTY ACID EXPORT 1, chloroplastic isoform X2 [Nymphaea colorata]|nr:protein FATTY ACID EXPORT 1, chloroplastic isoform X2 [Nymphaea colorata]
MASVGSVTAKAQFSRERSTIYSFSNCNYSGLLASKKRLSLCPGRMDRSFVFSAISIRQQSQRSFAHPSFLTKECHRRTNAVNQDSIDNQSSHMEEPKIIEESDKKNDTLPADDLSQGKKRSAKIHDFCFGIPFGGVVLGAGVVGFLLSGNHATLLNGLFFGGALLGLSSYSLKVWRQGKSCLPFILGQSVLAVALLVKQFQIYALTKNLFPTGLYIITSAGMLCFYLYVLLSGGNPPPKKLKVATSMSS